MKSLQKTIDVHWSIPPETFVAKKKRHSQESLNPPSGGIQLCKAEFWDAQTSSFWDLMILRDDLFFWDQINGGIIWYLPPIKGTRNNHWSELHRFVLLRLLLLCPLFGLPNMSIWLNVNQGKASRYKSPQSKIAQIAKLIPWNEKTKSLYSKRSEFFPKFCGEKKPCQLKPPDSK